MKAALDTVTKTEGLNKVITEQQPPKHDGFLGTLTTLKINGERRKNERMTLNLLIRSASNSDALRMAMPVEKIYRVELHIYKNVFLNFRQLEIENSVFPTGFSPRFYYGMAEGKNETVIVENLIDLGYRVHPNDFTMDDNHASIVMAKLGKLHALSFALRYHKPEVFKKLVEPLKEDLFAECFYICMRKNIVNLCSVVLERIETSSNLGTFQALQSFVENMDDIYEKMMSSCLENYFVVSCGDCWCGAFMFKYQDVNNPQKPTSLRMMDFQMSNMCLPILDLSYFLYSCCSKKVVTNFELYLDLYYKSFSDHLCKLNCDPADLYPYLLFRLHWENYAKFALFIVPVIIQVTVNMKDDFESFNMASLAESKVDFSELFLDCDVRNSEVFMDRMMFIVEHLVKNKLL